MPNMTDANPLWKMLCDEIAQKSAAGIGSHHAHANARIGRDVFLCRYIQAKALAGWVDLAARAAAPPQYDEGDRDWRAAEP